MKFPMISLLKYNGWKNMDQLDYQNINNQGMLIEEQCLISIFSIVLPFLSSLSSRVSLIQFK